ncbi:phycocyanin beta chain-like [Pseudanabaena sp. lw0831]|uniref:phycocyanin n=1 Tax=Pseudanabaena sp. lw0831 TaxID=1357935 RepID=UPI00191568FF|nr:phycocyanin [Pseudanabaena sp. lw0831]GBO51890.1 phycocyanin beta chain-like [Pseudanabaena sp. lw0831]
MLTLLENVLDRADGSYITPEDLRTLDRSISSWQQRRQTYDLIQSKENIILEQVMQQIQTKAPDVAAKLTVDGGNKCNRDMALVLRYCATAMLLQDEEILKDRLLYWMQNIMLALKNQRINDFVYRSLQNSVRENLPKENADLLLPYIAIAHQWLSQ